MTAATRLIVLNATKSGETALVLHTLSPAYGRRSFLTNVGRKASMSLFLPLNILDAEVHENPRSDLWRAGNIRSACPLSGIRGNIYKNTMTLFMSEVLYRTVRDGVSEDGLFEWCERSILTLDAMEGEFANYHLRFLLEFASALGFTPDIESLSPFAGPHLARLQTLLELGLAEFMLVPMSGAERNGIAESLLRYIGYHTESSLNVRSLPVLRELYCQ